MIQDRICQTPTCGRNFQGGPRAYYCPSCREERQRQQSTEHKRRKRKGETRLLGSSDKCERCGEEYTVKAGLQRFCETCQPIHNAEYDAKTSLEFYAANKERINPPRKLKRRKRGNECGWCGNKFEPVNGNTTCSNDCRRHHLRNYGTPEGSHVIQRISMIGEKYGKLTVISEIAQNGRTRRFFCRCDCGEERNVAMTSLRSGNTKSCGCLKSERVSEAQTTNLVDKRFGKLTVLERYYKQKTVNRSANWLCVCDCGESVVRDAPSLVRGAAVGCRKCASAQMEERRRPLGKEWTIVSPDGNEYKFINLKKWVRDHKYLLDGTFNQAYYGINRMRSIAIKGVGKSYQWKGWRLKDWRD